MGTCVLLLSYFRVEVLPLDPECAGFFWLPLHLGVSHHSTEHSRELFVYAPSEGCLYQIVMHLRHNY